MRSIVGRSLLALIVSSLALMISVAHAGEVTGLEERDLQGTAYKTIGTKCVDSSWLHNLQHKIVEVPSRFQRTRSCRKSDGFVLNLAGNKAYKYGYNLNNDVDLRVLASYQSKARCPVEILPKTSLPRLFCPTRQPNGPWISLANFLLCDGIKNCPNGEDEERAFCNYYRTVLRDLQKNFIQIAQTPQDL